MGTQIKLNKINNRTTLYQFLVNKCYQKGTTPTKLSYKICNNNHDSYLHKIIMTGSKRLIKTKINAIASSLNLSVDDLWTIVKRFPNNKSRKRYVGINQDDKRLKNYLTCLLFLKHISYTQVVKKSHHDKDWVAYRLYRTKDRQSKLMVLKIFSNELNVPISNFQMIIKDDLRSFKLIMNKMTNKVYDRRSLLNLFMATCYLHGTTLSDMSSKYGYQHHYFGKAIKMRTSQTIIKNLSSVANEIGIYDLPDLVDQANIKRGGEHTNMKGHGTYSKLPRKDRDIVASAVKDVIYFSNKTYRELSKQFPYTTISSEISYGSRRGIVKTLAWLTVKMNLKDNYFLNILNRGHLGTYKNQLFRDIDYMKI